MWSIKCIILALIFGISCTIGKMYSDKYKKREIELKEMKTALNMFESKVKYTYETIPNIFNEISKSYENTSLVISNIFNNASGRMNKESAGEAWIHALDSTYSNFNDEDKNILKSLSKMLGKTDLDGQVNEIELTNNFLKRQIEKAETERAKNEKMYKTLGVVCGVGIVIVLI